MITSKLLAKILGLYLLVTGLLMIFNQENMVFNIKQLLENPSLIFLSGFITLILAILVLVTHFRWKWGWPLIITILGCWLFIKSLILLLFPQFLGPMFAPLFQTPWYGYAVGVIIIIFATYLLCLGFSKKS